MSPTRLDVTFDSSLLDRSSVLDRLRMVPLPAFPLSWAGLEFAVIAAWAFTPFVVAFLVS